MVERAVCRHRTSLFSVERVEGPGCRIGTRAPKELLHHLPTLILHRPPVSADPTELLSGIRGSRLLDRRPPHYRCPAVPGLKTSARAILMAPGSSVLPSEPISLTEGELHTADTAYCCWPAIAPLFDSQPRRLSCICPGLEPHCRTSRYARPQPTPSPRVLLTDFTAVLRTALAGTALAVLLTTAPDHCGPPGPVVSLVAVLHRSGFETPPPHRPATALTGTSARQFISAGPCSISVTRETITTPPPNVYSGRHRFSAAGRWGNRTEQG